jgi:hypothetical protein
VRDIDFEEPRDGEVGLWQCGCFGRKWHEAIPAQEKNRGNRGGKENLQPGEQVLPAEGAGFAMMNGPTVEVNRKQERSDSDQENLVVMSRCAGKNEKRR